jgi:hypothetical protein
MSDYRTNLDSLPKPEQKQNFLHHTTQSTGKNRRLRLHSETIKALETAVKKSDCALSTALLQNEGFSFDFALVVSARLMGGEVK